jgi:hypothetical protein
MNLTNNSSDLKYCFIFIYRNHDTHLTKNATILEKNTEGNLADIFIFFYFYLCYIQEKKLSLALSTGNFKYKKKKT